MNNISFKKKVIIHIFVLTLCFSQAGICEDKNSVNITWQELKKLLKIDSDKITLELSEFKQIIKQTGEDVKIPYTVKNGKVILPRKTFTELLDRMKCLMDDTPSSNREYILSKAEYSGTMGAESTRIRADFTLTIFKGKERKYHIVPLIHSSAGIESVTMDGKPALLVVSDGWYCVSTYQTGVHSIQAEYYTKSDIMKRPEIFAFPIVRTPITTLSLRVPLQNVDLSVDNSRDTIAKKDGKYTEIEAILSSSNSLNVNAHIQYETQKISKLPAKIYASALNLLSIDDDAIKITANINLNILQNSIQSVHLRIPEGFTILNARLDGEEIFEWSPGENKKTEIPFNNPLKGAHNFVIEVEKILEDEGRLFEFNGIEVCDAERETGFIGAEKISTAQAVPEKSENLDLIDIKDLPAGLINMSDRPLVFGYKYFKHPYKLRLKITKHEELPVINSIIDKANIITTVLPNGKTLTQMNLTVRNTWKQFLKLEIPEDSEIMTLYVDKKRENASESDKGEILIPLARSQRTDEIYRPFEIELLYLTKSGRHGLWGSNQLEIPTADILISKMLWSVYLPEKYNYIRFSGNVEKEALAQTFNLILGKKRKFNLDLADQYNAAAEDLESKTENIEQKTLNSVFSNESISSGDVAQQIRMEANLNRNIARKQSQVMGTAGAGSNIFKIDLPTTGQIYRFNKTIIESEPTAIKYIYLSKTISFIFKLLLIAFVIFLIFILRKKIVSGIKAIADFIKTRHGVWTFLRSPSGLRASLFIGAIVFYFISHFIFVILCVLFIIAVFRKEWLIKVEKVRDSREQ